MSLKYVDDNGLLYFWQKIGNKFVAQETGKGLSENDLTDTLKATYDDAVSTVATLVAEGGEPNVIEIVKRNGTALTVTNKAVDVTVPTNTSDLTNDSNFVADSSYVHTDNNFTNDLKTKLTGVASGAQVNVIETIKVNGTSQTVTSKAVDITVPTNNNQLTNGAGYQTASDVSTAIDNKISSVYKPKGSVAFANLPSATSTNEGNVYNITDSFTTTSSFVEGEGKTYPAGTNVVIVNTSGTTYKYDVLSGVVDLSGYVQSSDLVAITNAEIDVIVAN